mmetsp:Transcript_3324/g.9427  ORF Transcript_3324/g.9427 Transcript_3324/m.9427 type:complete len:261 (+) Transcript_3324:389-1171(+)
MDRPAAARRLRAGALRGGRGGIVLPGGSPVGAAQVGRGRAGLLTGVLWVLCSFGNDFHCGHARFKGARVPAVGGSPLGNGVERLFQCHVVQGAAHLELHAPSALVPVVVEVGPDAIQRGPRKRLQALVPQPLVQILARVHPEGSLELADGGDASDLELLHRTVGLGVRPLRPHLLELQSQLQAFRRLGLVRLRRRRGRAVLLDVLLEARVQLHGLRLPRSLVGGARSARAARRARAPLRPRYPVRDEVTAKALGPRGPKV